MTWVCWSWTRGMWHAKGGDPDVWTDDVKLAGQMSWGVVTDVMTTPIWHGDELLFQSYEDARENGRPKYHTYRGDE